MNTQPDDVLSVSTPADLIALVPYLLGFHPQHSAVVVAVRDHQVVVLARTDLPDPGTDPKTVRPRIKQIAAQVAADGATAAGADRIRPRRDGNTGHRHGPGSLPHPRGTDPRVATRSRRLLPLPPVHRSGLLPDRRCPVRPVNQPGRRRSHRRRHGRPARPTDARRLDRPGRRRRPAGDAPGHHGRAARLVDLLKAATTAERRRKVLQRSGREAVDNALDQQARGMPVNDEQAAWLCLLLADIPVRDHAWTRTGVRDADLHLWPI